MGDNVVDFEIEELETFIEKYLELNRGGQRPKGIFSILPGSREGQYQYALAYFLNPQSPHGFGYTLLETFLDCIGIQQLNLQGQHIEIDDEVWIADDGSEGRIDLVICGGSALAEHPQWTVFVELKVGAAEGTQQTTTYASADAWEFGWFETSEITVDALDDAQYVYVKRAVADGPNDATDTFDSVDWRTIVDRFETEVGDALFEYPNRSVIQFTDFIQSVKETEGMDSGIDEAELNERLHLYFEHDRLIQQVEKANSQFESDFENLSAYLKDSWENKLVETFNFEASGWKTSPSGNPKWQGILPEYWDQDPRSSSSTIKLFFRHSPTTDALRDRQLLFRLRLPPARNVHTKPLHDGQSFNDVFAEYCTGEYNSKLRASVDALDVDTTKWGTASALVAKAYPLDPQNLTGSYFEQLERAVTEFCCDNTEFLDTVNEVFEQTYRDVFGALPEGEYPGRLPKRH